MEHFNYTVQVVKVMFQCCRWKKGFGFDQANLNVGFDPLDVDGPQGEPT